MATIRFILGIICLVGTLGNGLFDSDRLRGGDVEFVRREVVWVAQGQIGVREIGGKNKGKQVEAYLAYTNLKRGNPWCAAFVSWVYGQAGFTEPKTAWSPSLFPTNRITKSPKTADVFGIYFPQLKRIAHCGLVEKTKNDWIVTIEGNTNVEGSNEGDGVYRKWRHRKTIAVCSDWLGKKGGGDE